MAAIISPLLMRSTVPGGMSRIVAPVRRKALNSASTSSSSRGPYVPVAATSRASAFLRGSRLSVMGSPRGGGFHCHADRDDLAGRFAAHDGVDVVGPALQGVATGLVHRIDL